MKFLDGIHPVTVTNDNGILASIMNGAGETIIVFSLRLKASQDLEAMFGKTAI